MVYVGMDVHRKRTQVAILDEGGHQVLNRSIPNDPAELTQILGRLETGTSVAFEATYAWGWVAELLDDLGLEAHLAHPGGCKAIASARLKNDRVDARTLAHLLRADLLHEAWLAPKEVRELRALLRHRVFLVRIRTKLKTRIQAVIADQGLHPGDRLWTKAGRAWLQALDLPAAARRIVDDCLGLIDTIEAPISELEKQIARLAKPDPRVEALEQLPGVGRITAMTLISEIGEIARFPTARKLCAWAGLTPTVRNSADKVRHGHISKQGPGVVRWILTEAAHKAQKRPPFSGAYAKIARRRGKNIATTAIARKLLARCFHLLKEVEERGAAEKGLRAG